MLGHSSANKTARHDAGSGGRGAGNPGIGPSSALSHGNTGAGTTSRNPSYNNHGRGSNIPSGPRAGVSQPRPPPKAVDPSAMEVLGLRPPERPPPPSRSDGPTGYLDSNDRGPIHPAPRQQQQQQQRPPQQQPGGSYGGPSSGVSTSFARVGLNCANMYIFYSRILISPEIRGRRKRRGTRVGRILFFRKNQTGLPKDVLQLHSTLKGMPLP